MVGGPRREFTDDFATDPETAAWIEERFTMRPVAPEAVEERLAAGETLATVDVPEALDRTLTVDPDAAAVLYRLAQLFGTPNVTPLAAGADQPERELRTWQYLFEVRFDGDDEDDAAEWLASVYDYKTEVSAGLSGWHDGDDAVPEPTGAFPEWLSVPPERLLVGTVQLVRLAVESPVRATYEDLWV